MEILIENKKGLDAQLRVKVKADDYQDEVKKALTTYQKKMNVPGFRAGKVPMGLVNKMIGKDVKKEQVDKLLQKNIQDYLKDNEVKLVLSPISTYMAEDVDWQAPEMDFTYDIGFKPEIQPAFKHLDELTRYKVALTEEEVDTEIDLMRKQGGKMDMAEEITGSEAESVAVQFRELDDDGNVMESGQQKMKLYQGGDMPESIKNLLKGKKAKDKVSVDLFELLSEDEIEKLFEVDKMTVKDLNKMFELEVLTIFSMQLAEADQNFFDKYVEPGKASNLDEFREEWKKMIENYYQREADAAFHKELKKSLLENTKVDMPEEYLKKYLVSSYEAKSESDIKDFDIQLKKLEEELKWVLISDEIAEKNSIQINDENVLDYTRSLVRSEFYRSNMPEPDDKTVQQYAINYLKQESNYSRTIIFLKDSAVFEHIKGIISPKEESISTEKLTSMKKQNHDHSSEQDHEHHDHE
jgi:trigger factor